MYLLTANKTKNNIKQACLLHITDGNISWINHSSGAKQASGHAFQQINHQQHLWELQQEGSAGNSLTDHSKPMCNYLTWYWYCLLEARVFHICFLEGGSHLWFRRKINSWASARKFCSEQDFLSTSLIPPLSTWEVLSYLGYIGL